MAVAFNDDYGVRELSLALLRADTEEEVIAILTEAEFWDNSDAWRYYGDKEDNFSTVGNQQSTPEAALVEKAVNAVDAVLIGKCWESGVPPGDDSAPQSIRNRMDQGWRYRIDSSHCYR